MVLPVLRATTGVGRVQLVAEWRYVSSNGAVALIPSAARGGGAQRRETRVRVRLKTCRYRPLRRGGDALRLRA